MDANNIESEAELISTARSALNKVDWIVGECAFKWTKRHAKGRTDADFAAQVGGDVDGNYIQKRRSTFETFGDVYRTYGNLKWSHFWAAIAWDDAPECLAWADEQDATVAEMKAWRRMQHGEDLTAPADDVGVEQFGAAEELPTETPSSAPERKVDDQPGRPAVIEDGSDRAGIGRGATVGSEPTTARPSVVPTPMSEPTTSQQPPSSVTVPGTMATLATAEPATAYAPFKAEATKPTTPPRVATPPTPTTQSQPRNVAAELLTAIEQSVPQIDPCGFLVSVADVLMNSNRDAVERAVEHIRRRLACAPQTTPNTPPRSERSPQPSTVAAVS